MNYWEGYMNWPLVAGWKCQTCESSGPLIWGLQHAACLCETCHTQYYMRDESGRMTDTPICMLKEEYKAPAKIGYAKLHTPISEWGDAEWDALLPAPVKP